MKFISQLLAVYVLLLSIMPTFIEDKCIKENITDQGQSGQDEQDCNEKCCSPFFSCNTCSGFVLSTFNFSITHSLKEPQIKIRTIAISPVSDFPFSVWHPPQFV